MQISAKEGKLSVNTSETVPDTSINSFSRITYRLILDSTTYGEITMYKEFLELLEKATGRSEYVIAVNLDIRSFTPFCQKEDPLHVATYLKKIYSKIITGYFKNTSFYKPTGDGLIIIIPFTEEKLQKVARKTINSCLNLLENFGSLCDNEPMVNFDTPDKIGIGLTRGSACCIISKKDNKILDYSGRILNFASRLMDMARPSGIIFDESFGINLLSDRTKKLFSEDTVHIRGVAEETPIKIHYTKKHTLISDSYHYPLKEPKWNTITSEDTLKTLKTLIDRYGFELDKKPLDENKIRVNISHPKPKQEGFRREYDYTIDNKEILLEQKGNKYHVILLIHDIIKDLESQGATEDMTIKIDIIYPSK